MVGFAVGLLVGFFDGLLVGIVVGFAVSQRMHKGVQVPELKLGSLLNGQPELVNKPKTVAELFIIGPQEHKF